MYTPFICTNNTLGHIDYKTPIVATKSTDYRTSTGSYHDLVPSKGQEFDCRVKARIKPHLKETPVLIRDDNATSLQKESFCWKSNVLQVTEYYPRGGRCDSRNFIRPLQEIVFRKPPRPKGIGLSETKDTYTFKQIEFKQPAVFPPEPYSKCEVASIGKEVQPPIPPAEPGYWKWLDPYMTTNRAHHIPFTTNQWNGLARKDHTTFYVAKGLPKVKGFGPRETVSNEPLIVRREYPMQDSIPFKLKIRGNVVYERSKKCPYSGTDTEYSRNYIHQSFSEIYADVHGNKVVFPESLSKASPFQDLCPPAMYSTEYCHIGTGWPVNSIINYGLPKEYVPRKKSDYCEKLAT